MTKVLAVVGAGPKAAAIAARLATLRDLGWQDRVPGLLVIEAEGIGAAWSGAAGFSSGFPRLCTPAEKDVGYPYSERFARNGLTAAVGPALFGRFSWQAYRVVTGTYTDWIDRGRDHPTHADWATYLAWVFEQADQKVTPGRVTRIRQATDGRWRVEYSDVTGPHHEFADGVLLTGAGASLRVPKVGKIPANRIYDSQNFWAARDRVAKLECGIVAVAGSGGAAGAIVAWLADQLAEKPVAIKCINKMATLFPRGDGFAERRWFSDPSDWKALHPDHRRHILERTEAGVVSLRNKQIIDRSPQVEYCLGKASKVAWDAKARRLDIDVEYQNCPAPGIDADYLIDAIGFDSWSLLADLVDHPEVRRLCTDREEGWRSIVEAGLCSDLSLPTDTGLPAGLHVPAIAGLEYGPGMPNLGCLGLMAERVLRSYLS